jgi:hypothetical protein
MKGRFFETDFAVDIVQRVDRVDRRDVFSS